MQTLAVIGARLNSSRLPNKHLLDLAGQPLIARLFARLEAVSGIDRVALATTSDAYNAPLRRWAESAGKEVFAYEGDVNDLVGRVDALARQTSPDRLVYVCGDSPLVAPAALDKLLDALDADPAADMAAVGARDGAAPIHEGFDVYRGAFWRRLADASVTPQDREHVGSARAKLADACRVVEIIDDPVYYRLDHRLSVDTPSDYRYMAELYRRWYADHPANSLVSLAWAIEETARDAELRCLNAQVVQRRVGQTVDNISIVTAAGAGIGLGHLSRAVAVARAFQDRLAAGVRLTVLGEPVALKGLDLLQCRFSDEDAATAIHDELAHRPNALIVDLPRDGIGVRARAALACAAQNTTLVSIDRCLPDDIPYSLDWVPSFYLEPALASDSRRRAGWDCFLLGSATPTEWAPGRDAVVLTGGSDHLGLAETLPAALDRVLPETTRIHWIQGPFSRPPRLPAQPRLDWRIHRQPPDPLALMRQSQYALALYGVSLFECLAQGLPAVALTANRPADDPEIAAFRQSGVAAATNDQAEAAYFLAELMRDAGRSKVLSRRSRELLDGGGPARLAETAAAWWRAPSSANV